MIRNSPTKSILSSSQHSTPQKILLVEQSSPAHEFTGTYSLKQQSSNKSPVYSTITRKSTSTPSPNHQLIQLQHHNIGNSIITMDNSVNNPYYPVVNHFQCQLPHNVIVHKQINATKLYPTSMEIGSSTEQKEQQQIDQQQQQQLQQYPLQPIPHILHIQSQQQHLPNNERNEHHHHSIHMQQFHTATVHGELHIHNTIYMNINKFQSYMDLKKKTFNNLSIFVIIFNELEELGCLEEKLGYFEI